MPFDLDQTTHKFTPTRDGLMQQVTTDWPGDTQQTALVRAHLADEVRRFQASDYADPARIHGSDMPGLAELSAGANRIEITYADVTDGAAIRFRTSDPALVQALHAWAAAQVSDHGQPARHKPTPRPRRRGLSATGSVHCQRWTVDMLGS
jgi:hypothetical protein